MTSTPELVSIDTPALETYGREVLPNAQPSPAPPPPEPAGVPATPAAVSATSVYTSDTEEMMRMRVRMHSWCTDFPPADWLTLPATLGALGDIPPQSRINCDGDDTMVMLVLCERDSNEVYVEAAVDAQLLCRVFPHSPSDLQTFAEGVPARLTNGCARRPGLKRLVIHVGPPPETAASLAFYVWASIVCAEIVMGDNASPVAATHGVPGCLLSHLLFALQSGELADGSESHIPFEPLSNRHVMYHTNESSTGTRPPLTAFYTPPVREGLEMLMFFDDLDEGTTDVPSVSLLKRTLSILMPVPERPDGRRVDVVWRQYVLAVRAVLATARARGGHTFGLLFLHSVQAHLSSHCATEWRRRGAGMGYVPTLLEMIITSTIGVDHLQSSLYITARMGVASSLILRVVRCCALTLDAATATSLLAASDDDVEYGKAQTPDAHDSVLVRDIGPAICYMEDYAAEEQLFLAIAVLRTAMDQHVPLDPLTDDQSALATTFAASRDGCSAILGTIHPYAMMSAVTGVRLDTPQVSSVLYSMQVAESARSMLRHVPPLEQSSRTSLLSTAFYATACVWLWAESQINVKYHVEMMWRARLAQRIFLQALAVFWPKMEIRRSLRDTTHDVENNLPNEKVAMFLWLVGRSVREIPALGVIAAAAPIPKPVLSMTMSPRTPVRAPRAVDPPWAPQRRRPPALRYDDDIPAKRARRALVVADEPPTPIAEQPEITAWQPLDWEESYAQHTADAAAETEDDSGGDDDDAPPLAVETTRGALKVVVKNTPAALRAFESVLDAHLPMPAGYERAIALALKQW